MVFGGERADFFHYSLREVQGTLKGHDQLMNLVLDDVQEMLRGMSVRVSTSTTSTLPNHALAFCIATYRTDQYRLQMTKATHPPAPSASSWLAEHSSYS